MLTVAAVAYDPKVVTIWEGLRSYFRDDAKLAVEVVLYLSYEAQVDALLASRVDIAWNTNLAFVQCERWTEGRAAPLATRDTDLAWETKIVALAGGPVSSPADLRGRTLALGSRDSGHAAILPVHFLAEQGLRAGNDYRALRFDSDVGKHGDTGRSEVEALRAVMQGDADACAVGSPFWHGLHDNTLVPQGALSVVWTSPPFHHCMFTARPELARPPAEAFVHALLAMRWDNPKHRPILEAEGLREWVPPRTEGYASLRAAAEHQGFFMRAR